MMTWGPSVRPPREPTLPHASPSSPISSHDRAARRIACPQMVAPVRASPPDRPLLGLAAGVRVPVRPRFGPHQVHLRRDQGRPRPQLPRLPAGRLPPHLPQGDVAVREQHREM